jgi:surfeit locus 1 family protein
MRSFQPRFIPTLASLIGVAMLMGLGTWQANRYGEKREIEELRDARRDLPPVVLRTLPEFEESENNYRMVEAHGDLRDELSMVFKFRTHKSKSGYWVVTPMDIDGGRILVLRGWVPVHIPPTDLVFPDEGSRITGLLYAPDRIIADEAGRASIQEIVPNSWPAWNTFDLDAAYKAVAGTRPKEPLVLVASETPDGVEWPMATLDHIMEPYMTSEKHMGYSLTWYTLGVCLIGLWLANAFGVLGSPRRSKK